MNEPPQPKFPPTIASRDALTLPLTHRATIPESYLDDMGHMNVMWYTHLFGHAIGSTFELIGLTGEYFLSTQSGAFALKQYVNYWSEVRAGQEISIRSRLLGRSAKRLHMMHFMFKESGGILAATSEVLLTHIDMSVRRSSPFPAEIAATIDRIVANHAGLDWPPPLAGPIQP